jgi:hypothetical protein
MQATNRPLKIMLGGCRIWLDADWLNTSNMCSAQAKELVELMLNRNEEQRPDIKHILAHEFVLRYVMEIVTDMGEHILP